MEVVDDDFLSLVEAAEAAAKKRKLDGAASAGHLEGSYTAALKGSKSLSWQQQTALDAASKPKTTRPSDDGNSCFKCGKPGHWARDCAGVGVRHDGSRNPASSAAAADEEKPCSCGAGPCLVLTANTERNRGRKFYRCPVREVCLHFRLLIFLISVWDKKIVLSEDSFVARNGDLFMKL